MKEKMKLKMNNQNIRYEQRLKVLSLDSDRQKRYNTI